MRQIHLLELFYVNKRFCRTNSLRNIYCAGFFIKNTLILPMFLDYSPDAYCRKIVLSEFHQVERNATTILSRQTLYVRHQHYVTRPSAPLRSGE